MSYKCHILNHFRDNERILKYEEINSPIMNRGIVMGLLQEARWSANT